MTLQFTLNGELRHVEAVSPTTTVLDYLRETAELTGTKEGCAEGDCGACTIVLAENVEGQPDYKAVNACLLMVAQLDGKHVLTVEGLATSDALLDPVQDAMVKTDGTQCGFCTPGIIMSLFALRQAGEQPSDGLIHDTLAGNLCRCTGYRPIVEAAREACAAKPDGAALDILEATSEYTDGAQSFLAPQTIDALAEVFADHPEANLLGGGTDLGILVSKEREALETVIHTGHVAELLEIDETETDITFGAAVTYSSALPFIERLFPSFATLITRIGSVQIRNVGTIGGNIGNASPIGDTPPCLIALDATLILYSKAGERELLIEEFFLDYRKTDLKAGEFIKAIRIPKLNATQEFRAYKISKRYDQDISAVIGAYRLELDSETVTAARIAYGGMAATPKRSLACEAALIGKTWNIETARSASGVIGKDYQPISDHRASAQYRLQVAGNLFQRLYQDISGLDQALEVVAV
ncbi:MAG: xanthine dehydrogenase small subunit [Rhodospirillaceae bacterium]|jgi:xanthine dehydrogenase small subunit|nr:xanthine dehydrogenase small subunit [Rhodospirillaceae bacterium]MBT5941270.1 xanthine dehydrogenase small subunit [Rhodospirillaceae bacterium]MBT7266916.1 xanthine dehydrogenase small subunit [Rhodospirillaceae bacterium]